MTIKDKRKPWKKQLINFKFNKEGTMTTETARAQKTANRRDNLKRQGSIERLCNESGQTFREWALDNGHTFHKPEETKGQLIKKGLLDYAVKMGCDYNAVKDRLIVIS